MKDRIIKGIIFDLDGTLIDSLEDLTDACNDVLREHGFPEKTYEEGKKLIGNGIRVLMQRALPEDRALDAAFVDQVTAQMKTCYARRYTNKTKAYDGIREVLTALKERQIPFGICTNKPDEAAGIIVSALFDRDAFIDVVGQRDSRPKKPDPTQTLALAAQMGVAPENCIYAGDSTVDYETAKNAGMLPLLCTWGFTDASVLKAYKDAVCIDTPARILAVLDGQEA